MVSGVRNVIPKLKDIDEGVVAVGPLKFPPMLYQPSHGVVCPICPISQTEESYGLSSDSRRSFYNYRLALGSNCLPPA